MYRTASWLRDVKEVMGERLAITWLPFSLEQVNSKEGPEWKVWEEPAGHQSRGLLALRAAEAARRQGPDAFERFHWELLKVRHEARKDLADRQVLLESAKEAGLDVERFATDLEDKSLLQIIGKYHAEAVEKYGVFGTPTLVFANGLAAFLKMAPPPPKEEAMQVFESLQEMIAQRPNIMEVKRPVPPKRD